MKNKSDFLKYIKASSKKIASYIAKHISDDEYWLNQLEISKSDNEIEDIVKLKLNDFSYNEVISELLKDIFSDYLIDEDGYHIFSHYVSFEGYTSRRALFVYQCSNQFFCYYFGGDHEIKITDNPIDFCTESMNDTINYFNIEQQNKKDEYFTDLENELHWNYRLDLSLNN